MCPRKHLIRPAAHELEHRTLLATTVVFSEGSGGYVGTRDTHVRLDAPGGSFGGSGTMMWVEPSIEAGVVALTDRSFDQWRDDAMQLWPAFSDAVVNERRRAA